MATFSDYLRNQGSTAGASSTPRKNFSPQQSAPAVPNYDFSWMPKPGQSVEEPEPQSPLNWAMDIISRPLFSATSTVTGISEAAARLKEGKNIFEAGGAFLDNNPFVGLLSTDKEQKRTYSDVMEEQTDRHGAIDDPNYVDVEDNLDPVMKGIAGFGLDVLADPLTWIPGGLIVKGVKAAGQGASKALGAGEKIVKKATTKVAKESEKLGEAAVKVADDAPTAPAARVSDDVIEDTDNVFGGAQMTSVPVPASRAAEEVVETAAPAAKVAEPAASVAAKIDPHIEFMDTFRKAPTSEELRGILQGVQKAIGSSKTVKNVSKVVDDGQPIPGPEMKKFASSEGALGDEFYDLSEDLQIALVNRQIPGPDGSYAKLLNVASKQSPVEETVRAEAKKVLRTRYFERTLGKAETQVKVLENAQQAFQFARQSETERFEKVLGSQLTDVLSKKSPKGLEASMSKIVEVLDPTASDDVIRRFYEGRNMKQLSTALNDALDLPVYVKPTANTPEKVTAVRERLSDVQTDADIAVVKTLRVDVTDAKQTYPVKEGNVRFTELDKQARIGRHVRQLNTQHQYTLWRNLDEAIKKRMSAVKGVPAEQLAGARRAQAYRQAFYEAGDSAADTYSALGLKLHLGTGHAEDLVPMNLFEAYRLVERGFESEQVALSALFNYGSAVAPTRLMEGVFAALNTSGRSADEMMDAVLTVLQNKKLSGYRGQVLDKSLPNNALKAGGKLGHFPGKNGKAAAQNFAKSVPGSKVVKNGDKGYYVVTGPGGLIEPIARAIVNAAPQLQARVSENIANYAARGIDEASSLSNSTIKELREILGSGDMEDVLTALSRTRKAVTAQAEEIGAFPSSVAVAEEIVEGVVGKAEIKVAKAMKTADTDTLPRAEAVAKSSQKVADDLDDEMSALVNQDLPDPLDKVLKPDVDDSVPAMDFGSMHADPVVVQQAFIGAKLGGLRKAFDASYGMGRWWNVLHSKRTNVSEFLAAQTVKLRELRKLPEEAQVAAWNAVRTGVPNSNAEAQAGADLIESIIDPIFGPSGNDSLLNNVFLSTEGDLGHINDILRQKFGQETSFQLDEAVDGWKQWEMRNPSKDLYTLMDAAATVVEHRSIVGSFTSVMKKEGMLSTDPKPGFVRVENSGGSTFARLIPEGTYVDRQMAAELHRLDIMTRTDRNLQGEVGEFIRKSFIPTQNIWKQLVTVYRPGHHVRNVMGNSFMSWIDRGNRHYLSSQKDAFRVLAVKNNYTDADLVSALKSFTDDAMPTGGEVVVRGRFGEITTREMFEIFERNGLKSTYATSEDLMTEAGMGAIARAGERLSNSKPGQIAGGASHVIDHHGKMSHLIQILKQEAEGGRYSRYGKNLSKEKVIERAVRDVKRSHPDSLMLTPFEAKYRFLIPFYTWFAKTLPFAMESALRNPGRVAAIPKASYELAVATGVNPDSLIDPFPEDQLFPSYLTEGVFGPQFVGPDGQYININPGTPQFDMAKSLMDPLSMISPLLKIPAELATGSRVGGGQIRDMSDYLDQNLPLVSYLANMTGTSVTGSVPSLLQGKGFDPQAQVAAGNKDGFDQGLTFSNWFSGLNAQNWSRPNYINSAEIEKRNRLSGNDKGGF